MRPFCSSTASTKPPAVTGIVQRAVAETPRSKGAADQDQPCALDPRCGNRRGDIGERTRQDALRRRTRLDDHGGWAIRAIERRELGDDRSDRMDGEMNDE